jgi:hypothetical protein
MRVEGAKELATTYIFERAYRSAGEARARQRELEQQLPLLSNPGSHQSLRRSHPEEVEEQRALDRYIYAGETRQRELERLARDPRSHEHTEAPAGERERIHDRSIAEHVQRAHDLGLRSIEWHSAPGGLNRRRPTGWMS